MTHENYFDLEQKQRDAWTHEIKTLQETLPIEWNSGRILFEYTIPRMGKRLDVVLLLRGIIFILEYKTGDQSFSSVARNQAFNYAVDLNGYHRGSKEKLIVPILVSPGENPCINNFSKFSDNIYNTLESNDDDLISIIKRILQDNPDDMSETEWYENWEKSGYLPTPTIIEAATDLFTHHDVKSIANCESADNLTITSNTITNIINDVAQQGNGKKAIVFVTGVPGAGKTLVGLNIANAQHARGEHAVYLSGNGPLVTVLTEALARDTVKCGRINPSTNVVFTKDQAQRDVHSFLQPVHHYRDVTLKKLVRKNGTYQLEINKSAVSLQKDDGYGEVESVAIFDEAQRAWKREDLAKFLNDKNFPLSESAFFLWSMNLRKDYGVVVCLVGNGQEINHGEAGIAEWIRSVLIYFPEWDIHLSEYLAQKELDGESIQIDENPQQSLMDVLKNNQRVFFNDNLHLKISQRSLRSEKVADFVSALLDHRINDAKDLYDQFKKSYPIVLTRSIPAAKEWLKERSTEQHKKWLESKGSIKSIGEWIAMHLHEDTLKLFLEYSLPSSNIKKWISSEFPPGPMRDKLFQSANARGGTARDRIINCFTPKMLREYFRLCCPVSDIYEWLFDKLPDTEDKRNLLNMFPNSCRYGLVASSAAKRLKALGIEVKDEKQVSLANWFLDPTEDIRSSNFMEEVVSEFVIQGLELDYVGLIWDADFRSVNDNWQQYKFKGSSWNENSQADFKDYQLNAYRVLLTRARMGMVLVVPEGDRIHSDGTIDKTRLPEFYDCTYNYLKSLGLEEI